MSDIEPKKLKVTELREELKSRGLDAKGNKAQLVKRLEKALAAESGNDAAEADISTATATDLDTSHETDTSTLEQPKIDAPAPDPVFLEDDEPVPVRREPEPEPLAQEEPEPVAQEEPESITKQEPELAAEPEPVPEPEPQAEPEPQPTEAEEPEHVQQAQEAEPPQEEEAAMPEAEQQPSAKLEEQAHQPEAVQEAAPVEEQPAQPEPETTEAEMQQQSEEPATAEADFTQDVTPAQETKEPAAPGTEEMEAEDEQQGEFQVMDSVGGDSEAPEADQQDQRDRRGRKRRFEDDEREHGRERRRSRRSRSRSRSPSKRRSRSRSGDRDESRRHRSRSPPYYRRDRQQEPMENEDWLQETTLQLDRFNADLNLRIGEGGCKCNPITVEGFAFMWAGARSNYGVNHGKVAFELKILEHLNVDHLPSEEVSRHVVRLGFSTDDTSLQLGEEKFSYGFGGTGKASTDCKFNDFGETFGEGDALTCYLDMDAEPHTISYAKNGNDLGTCFEIEKESLEGKTLFPHVLSKNCELEINFGQKEEPFFPLQEGYVFVNDVPVEERIRGTLPAEKKEDCEVTFDKILYCRSYLKDIRINSIL